MIKEKDVVREKKEEKCGGIAPFEFQLACLDPSFFCDSLNIVCILRNEGVPSFRLCASLSCVEFRRLGGGLCHH